MTTKRNELKKMLAKKFPKMWIKDGEEFDYKDSNFKNSIWTGEGSELNDFEIFNHYANDINESAYTMGVLNELHFFLKKHGWYASFYDGGTVFLYEI